MDRNFFDFVANPDKEHFLRSRHIVITDSKYNPYSDDLSNLGKLLDEGKFDEVSTYNNVNVLLRPMAHLYKAYAFNKMGMEAEEKAESILASQILENITLTGNGSKELPYIITRIDDEKDVLAYIEEQFMMQALVKDNERFYDCLTTQNGKKVYFNITDCYAKISGLSLEDLLGGIADESKRKWWKLW